jgi:hypothetical protein
MASKQAEGSGTARFGKHCCAAVHPHPREDDVLCHAVCGDGAGRELPKGSRRVHEVGIERDAVASRLRGGHHHRSVSGVARPPLKRGTAALSKACPKSW